MMVFYFAYGSNMDLSRMRQRGVIVKERFPGVLRDWTLVFDKVSSADKHVGFANIEHNNDSDVEGVIYELDENSIEKLDKFEGCPNQYHREMIKVRDRFGKIVKCVAYVANAEKTSQGLAPTQDYVQHLLKGKLFLSQRYFDFLAHLPRTS